MKKKFKILRKISPKINIAKNRQNWKKRKKIKNGKIMGKMEKFNKII